VLIYRYHIFCVGFKRFSSFLNIKPDTRYSLPPFGIKLRFVENISCIVYFEYRLEWYKNQNRSDSCDLHSVSQVWHWL